MGLDSVPEMTFDPSKDYYAILGVGKDATLKQIIQAYKKQALLKHPDKNGSTEGAKAVFQELGEANKVLQWLHSEVEERKGFPNRKKYIAARAHYVKNKDELNAREERARAYTQTREDVREHDNQKNNPAEITKSVRIKSTPNGSKEIPKLKKAAKLTAKAEENPKDFAEMIQWLEQDAAANPNDERFILGNAQPIIWKNLWELIEKSRISYAEYQSLTGHELRLFTQVILRDQQMTAQFCQGLANASSSNKQSARVIDTFESRKPGRYICLNKDFVAMEIAASNPLSHEEKLFLYLVNRETQRTERQYVQYGVFFTPLDSHGIDPREWLDVLKVEKLVFDNIIELVRDYRRKLPIPAPITSNDLTTANSTDLATSTLDELRLKLIAREEMIRHLANKVLIPAYRHWVLPIQHLIDAFTKNEDPISKVRVIQLEEVLKQSVLCIENDFKMRLGNMPTDLHTLDLKARFEKLATERPKAQAELFEKIIDLKEKYIKQDFICGHRNQLRAVLKTVGCWLAAALTVGIAPAVSSYIRHGMFYHTARYGTLLDTYEALRKTFRKANPNYVEPIRASKSDNPVINALMFRV